MKKKVLAALLCTAMVVSMAAGCGSSSKTDSKDEKKTEKSADDTKDVAAVDQREVFVSPDWVKSVIDGNQKESDNYKIFEVSWGAESDSPTYADGHIPGAIHFDTEQVECEPYWNLCDADVLEKALLGMGITKDTTAIFYGDPNGEVARVAYACVYAGVENVKVVNGGIDAWKNAGYDMEKDSNEAKAETDFGTTVPAHPEYWVSIDDAKDRVKNDDNFKLVSIRSKDEWLGKTSGYTYIDRAGEPEGAVWGHCGSDPYNMEDYVKEDGTVISFDEMKELWSDCDFTIDNELAFYCGTGWRACVPFLIAYGAGYDNVAVYDGGWYQWQMDDSNPVQVGDPTSADCQHTTVGELPTDKAAK